MYYDEEINDIRGNCDIHGEFVGDAIGCPDCHAMSEAYESEVRR